MNSSGAVNWQRHEEVVSGQGGDSSAWNQGPSRSRPTHNQVFENLNHFSNSLQLNQDEFPTLGAAADSKFQSTTVKKEDKRNERQDQRSGNSTSYFQTHRGGWYEDERQMQQDHSGNELVSGINNLHHPPAVHHGAYYPPMQMYPGAHGRPMVQHQGYYAHVPYSDGSYHPPPGHFYPPMYATYHQGYLPGEPYDQRSGGTQFNPRKKVEDNQQNSTPMRWTGERPPARLIKRQTRGDGQQQDQDSEPQEEGPARTESLTTEFLQRRKEESQELDWDAQVDAEEKRKDEKTQVADAVLDEIKQESVMPMPEWNYAKFRASLEAEEYVPSPALSNRRFVNPIPPKERRNYSDDASARGRGFLIRGRYRPPGGRRQEAETRSNADSSSENQASHPVRMFPGRGFRPKGPPPRSPKTPHSTTAPDSQQDSIPEDGLHLTVPDRPQSTPLAASSELGTAFAESVTESEEGAFNFGVGRLIRPRASGSTPRGRHSRGRFRGNQRFLEHRGRRSPRFTENQSPKLSDRGGGRYRGRGVHTPRSEGSSYRGGSRGRGRGRSGFPRDNGRSYGRGRGQRESFTPRGQRGGHLPASPKMQWVPKQPPSSDGKE